MKKNMKRAAAVTLIFLGCLHPKAHAALAGGFQNIPAVMARGLSSLASAPLELIRSPMAESKEHPKIWPLTSGLRTLRNGFYRGISGIYDILFYPLAMPFIKEARPMTERLGISNSILSTVDDF